MINIKPQFDRILVKIDNPKEHTTASGIVLVTDNNKNLTITGVVVDVGPGRHIDGTFITSPVLPGDRIIFGATSFANIDEPSSWEDHGILRFSDVLAVVEEVEEPVLTD